MEAALFAVRSSQEHFIRPYSVVTSPRVENCFFTCFNQDTATFVTRLEAYCLTGFEGMLGSFYFIAIISLSLRRYRRQAFGGGRHTQGSMH